MSSYSSLSSLSQVIRRYEENTRPRGHVEYYKKENKTMFKNQKGATEVNDHINSKRFDYEVDVRAVRPTKNDDSVIIDICVNGVSIDSCVLKELTVKKDGEKYKKGDTCYVLQFPQEKVGDKYYNRVWFPVSNETVQNIVDQVEKML